MANIDICICTFQRPLLSETLASIARLDPGEHAIRVIIADNDHTPSARDLVEAARPLSPFPLVYVHAPAANICVARNACLDQVEADYIAFVDDDETVTSRWITALHETAQATGATAVLGPVHALYGEEPPRWMVEGDFHSTLPVFVGGTIRTGYTCNVLIRWAGSIKNLRFDPALGRSGGEDTAFFYRLTAQGGAIAFAPDAMVEERVPPHRATMNWLVRRRLRFGQTHGILQSGSRASALPLACAKIAYCLTMSVLTGLSPVQRRQNWLRATLHVGVVRGMLGMRQATNYGQSTPS